MGFVGGLLGMGGGAAGTGFAKPGQANILNPTTTAQTTDAYNQNQTALQQQQSFLQAVQAQNGLQNQSNVYGQLQNVAAGQGPNPAQAVLNQATGQNVASQAALMAGQRGSGANAGLMARQAAQQGAATQQQAAGQGATMQANQSLAALGQAGAMANTQAAQQAQATGAVTGAQQNEQSQLLNSIAQQNNANVGMQSNINSGNASLAGQTMGMQGNLLGNITGGIGSALGLAEGGVVKMADGGSYGDTSTDNFDTALATPMPAAPAAPTLAPIPTSTSAPNTPKSVIGKGFKPNWNIGTAAGPNAGPQGVGIAGNMVGQSIGQGIKALGSMFSPKPQPQIVSGGAADSTSGGSTQTPDAGASTIDPNQTFMAAHGGKVPALVSPGEIYLKPRDVKEIAKGKKSPLAGEKIPGKPKVKGAKNDYANDTVPKTLEEGGIVLPRSVTQSKNPHWAAHAFVRDIMMKKHRGKK